MNRGATRNGSRAFVLTDTGFLVAFVDADNLHFQRALEALKTLPKVPLLTTWPCLTEAMYLLYQAGGFRAQQQLWGYVADGLVVLHAPSEEEWRRMRVLMAEYQDAPMDFADASVVAAAEALSVREVFNFDGHFYAYRMADGAALAVLG